MRRLAGAFAALSMMGGAANATASLGCEIDDASLDFAAEGAIPYFIGGGLLNFKSQAEIRLAGTPEDLRKLTLDGKLTQYWILDGELRLLLYHERSGDGPFASVTLIIKTAMAEDETSFPGTYRLSVYIVDPAAGGEGKTLAAEGKVNCSMG